MGLRPKVDESAGSLTLAERKQLELARAPRHGTSAAPPRRGDGRAECHGDRAHRALIRGIARSGATILLIEHIMRAVMSLSERVIAINLGGS
jgi:branched-chain amino acid transport system ATP-binding protein